MPISCARAVNRIIDKFKTSPPEFLHICGSSIVVLIGFRRYVIDYSESYSVYERVGEEGDYFKQEWSAHAKWVENMLNGKVRNESGEMVAA